MNSVKPCTDNEVNMEHFAYDMSLIYKMSYSQIIKNYRDIAHV